MGPKEGPTSGGGYGVAWGCPFPGCCANLREESQPPPRSPVGSDADRSTTQDPDAKRLAQSGSHGHGVGCQGPVQSELWSPVSGAGRSSLPWDIRRMVPVCGHHMRQRTQRLAQCPAACPKFVPGHQLGCRPASRLLPSLLSPSPLPPDPLPSLPISPSSPPPPESYSGWNSLSSNSCPGDSKCGRTSTQGLCRCDQLG